MIEILVYLSNWVRVMPAGALFSDVQWFTTHHSYSTQHQQTLNSLNSRTHSHDAEENWESNSNFTWRESVDAAKIFGCCCEYQMEPNHVKNCIYVKEPSIMNMSWKYSQPFAFAACREVFAHKLNILINILEYMKP